MGEAWPLAPQEPAAISVSRADGLPVGQTDGREQSHALGAGIPAALAVSGGADSFALLHWAWQAGKPIVALTVDHALRAGSAAEAQAVRTFCSERNIPHETLMWRGEKPETGIQEAARNARYRLLCQACERLGTNHLITAHTADDQAETVFMRLRRGAGRGLAAMPAQRQIAAGPGELITLHRPMLNVRRTEARAYAVEHEVPFVDDPSNEDEKYERVRVRALLAALEQQDLLTVDALCRTAFETAAELSFLDVEDWDAERSWDCFFLSTGAVSIEMWDEAAWDEELGLSDPRSEITPLNLDWHLRQRLLRQAMGAIADMPSQSRVPVIRRGESRTLGACVVKSEGRYLNVLREPAALLGRADGTPGFSPIPATPGSKHLYDKRFIVEVPQDVVEGTMLRPLGQLLPRDIANSTLSRQRVATLPILAKGERATHLPKQAIFAVREALEGWKSCDEFLPETSCSFVAQSLLAERFAGSVIRY